MATLKTCPQHLADERAAKLFEAVRFAKEDKTREIYRRVKRTAFCGAVFAVCLVIWFSQIGAL